jgi:hypothetical protein
MASSLASLCLCAFLSACGPPDATVTARVPDDAWRTLAPSRVQVRHRAGTLTVALADVEVAHGSDESGARIAFSLPPACAVTVVDRYVESDTDYRASSRQQRTTDLVERTYRGIVVKLACDGPVPGTDASLRGANRTTLLWGLPAFVLAILAGVLAHRDKALPFVGSALASIVAAIVSPIIVCDGFYIVKYAVVFLAAAAVGYLATRVILVLGKRSPAPSPKAPPRSR